MRHVSLATVVVSSVFVGALVYGYFKAEALIQGPLLSITTPTPGSTSTEPVLSISGTARHIASITLNGAPIFVNSSGEFTEELLLGNGYTILTIEAKDRFGRTITKTLPLYKPPLL